MRLVRDRRDCAASIERLRSGRRLLWWAKMKYWLPVVGWMLLIFIASTDLMSAQHTSRFIGPFLLWLDPSMSPDTIRAVQFAVRKAAHVTEYAILAALLVRAFYGGVRAVRPVHVLGAVLIASTYAALDEFHQSFVASRTGSPGDVLIDASGAVLGALLWWWQIARRSASRITPAHRGVTSAA
jgi:VanZ family protein